MSNTLVNVSLTRNLPTSAWRDNNLVSLRESEIIIHLLEEEPAALRIQKAAKMILGMGAKQVQLIGEGWNLEEQWAFHQGFFNAKQIGGIEAPSLMKEAQHELEARKKHFTWAKQLVNATPEVLSPAKLARDVAEHLTSLATDCISFRILQGDELVNEGYVGIYNVGRGSDRPPAMLVLDYSPAGHKGDDFDAVLVGKGITFDSGGYSIKPSESMFSMKCDMAGAATVAAGLALAIERGLTKKVRLILCCAENLISGHAYKLGDILTYKNGVSVEIANTDAEGRLVLADGLLLASESKAPLIIDAATLTGAAMVAVGEDYNACFTLSDALREQALTVSQNEEEALWPLPLAKFHRHKCPSSFADTANSRAMKGGGMGGASNAAGFLSRFVTQAETRWLHLDLAAAYIDSGNDQYNAGATGHGIRTIAGMLVK
ncbi:MAG: aminopeptidase PepB [Pseudomonadota bacterium]